MDKRNATSTSTSPSTKQSDCFKITNRTTGSIRVGVGYDAGSDGWRQCGHEIEPGKSKKLTIFMHMYGPLQDMFIVPNATTSTSTNSRGFKPGSIVICNLPSELTLSAEYKRHPPGSDSLFYVSTTDMDEAQKIDTRSFGEEFQLHKIEVYAPPRVRHSFKTF